MKILRKILACIALASFCGAVTAEQSAEAISAPFSDPSRPGTLHVGIITGSIVVRGGNVKDVSITTSSRDFHGEHSGTTGLRRLPQAVPITVEERNNRMEIGSPFGNRAVDLEIQVPTHTHLDLSNVNQGSIEVEGVEGELEIGSVNGSITLTDVAGSVVTHTINGKVQVTLTRVTPQKPMAFTSLNGAVEVDLPADIKANLKLRTDNGKVFTDFDLSMLPQPNTPAIEDTRRSGGRYRIEVNKVIYGAVNGGGPDIEMRTFNGSIFVRKNK